MIIIKFISIQYSWNHCIHLNGCNNLSHIWLKSMNSCMFEKRVFSKCLFPFVLGIREVWRKKWEGAIMIGNDQSTFNNFLPHHQVGHCFLSNDTWPLGFGEVVLSIECRKGKVVIGKYDWQGGRGGRGGVKPQGWEISDLHMKLSVRLSRYDLILIWPRVLLLKRVFDHRVKMCKEVGV